MTTLCGGQAKRLNRALTIVLLSAFSAGCGARSSRSERNDPQDLGSATPTARDDVGEPDHQPATTLQVQIDVASDGTAEVASVRELSGSVRYIRHLSSAYVAKVQSRGEVLDAMQLPEMFEQRGFASPGHNEEFRATLAKQQVLVYVPGKSAADEDYEITIHQLASIPMNSIVDKTTVERLLRENGASTFARVQGRAVGEFVRSRAVGNVK